MKIKENIHKVLFPSFYKRIKTLTDACSVLHERTDLAHKRMEELRVHVSRCEKELKAKPKVTTQNISEILGAVTLDFVNVTSDGVFIDFLHSVDKDKRKMYITQLAQIFELEVWHDMVKSHINSQGNFIARKATDDLQLFCGRMIMKGISLLRDDVKTGFDEFQEGRNPDNKDFELGSDESFEIGEGIPVGSSEKLEGNG